MPVLRLRVAQRRTALAYALQSIALYREGLRRRKPMTVVADTLLRQSLGRIANDPPLLRVCEDPTPYGAKFDNPEAA